MATWDGYNQSIIANRFQKSFMVNYVDLSGRLFVRQDVSCNRRLFVMNDASFMGNMYTSGNLTVNLGITTNGDVSSNNRLFVLNDASFMGNIYTSGNLTVNLGITTNGDVSLNSNVFVGRDISCNGNINIGRNLIVNGNAAIQNYTATNVINTTTTNYSLAVVEDISLNGRLSVSSDASLNGNLFVSKDLSLNGNVNGIVNFINDISVNGMTIGCNALSDVYCGNLASTNSTNHSTLVGYKSFTIKQAGAGISSTGLGFQTGLSVTTGGYNTAVGSQSLNTTTTGSSIVGIGYMSGNANLAGSNNTYIGYNTSSNNSAYIRTTVIGAETQAVGSYQFTIGRTSETVIIPRIERFLYSPMMIRSISSAVSFTTNIDTVILWGTSNYQGPYVSVSYNTSTGVFSNVESYTIGVSVSVSFAYAGNANGNRALWIKHSNASYSRIGHMELQGSSIDVTGLNITGNFSLSSSETFSIYGWQSSGGALAASGGHNTFHPCRIMITTY